MVEKLKSNPSNTEGEPSLEESKPSNEWWRAPSFIGICRTGKKRTRTTQIFCITLLLVLKGRREKNGQQSILIECAKQY